MNALLVSDLHFTDNPRDAYRWKLFEWLTKTIQEHSVNHLFILGDLTEAKDRHTARLVNLVVTSLVTLFRQTGLLKIHILRGNHDGLDPNQSYFRFLSKFPSITFYETPFIQQFSDREVLMLPHTPDPATAWAKVDLHTADFVFMHATLTGAVSETGIQLDGVPAGLLKLARRAKIISGDVHVPQKLRVGPVEVEYVGAPYPVRFNDKFEPRAMLLQGFNKIVSLPIDIMRRRTLTVTAKDTALDLSSVRTGDQVKVRIRLAPAEYGDWNECKRRAMDACAQAEVELCGIELEKIVDTVTLKPEPAAAVKSPILIFNSFCKANKVPKEVMQEGADILADLREINQ